MQRLVEVAVRRLSGLAEGLAGRLVGSRRTRRFLWAQWGLVRLAALRRMRPLYRRVTVEWDVPGHGRAVTSEVPGPRAREVLVRTVASVIWPERERASFVRDLSVSFPALPGYSLAGEVVAVGSSVASLQVGQLVATQAPHVSLVVRPAHLVFPLPSGVEVRDGACLFLGMAALQGLRQGDLRRAERVAVLGRGAIGQLVVQLARALGAGEIVSVASSDDHAGHSLSTAAGRLVAAVENADEALDHIDADLTVEASGAPDALLRAIRATRSGGRVVSVDASRHPNEIVVGMAACRGIALLDADVSSLSLTPDAARAYQEAAQQFLDLLAQGVLDLEGLMGREANPWEAGRLYRELAGRKRPWVTAVFRWDLLSDVDRMQRVHLWSLADTALARGMSMKQLPVSGMLRPPPMSEPG